MVHPLGQAAGRGCRRGGGGRHPPSGPARPACGRRRSGRSRSAVRGLVGWAARGGTSAVRVPRGIGEPRITRAASAASSAWRWPAKRTRPTPRSGPRRLRSDRALDALRLGARRQGPAERKLWLEEVEGGIVSGWRLLDQPDQESACLPPSLAAHRERFGRPPRLVAADRGVFSPENERLAAAAGVARVAIPAGGQLTPERARPERQRWFRRGFRFRAGIEGRISVLQRCYGLARCRDHGEDGIGRWTGWGIVVGNLERIARTVAARQRARAA